MTDLRQAAEQLLEQLEQGWVQRDDAVAIALRQALAQPEREWVGLTDDEIKQIMQRWRNGYIDIKDVEQLLKGKNT